MVTVIEMNNPYPFSNDNKRYQTMNYYFRTKYGKKVAKVPLNAGFTCQTEMAQKELAAVLSVLKKAAATVS